MPYLSPGDPPSFDNQHISLKCRFTLPVSCRHDSSVFQSDDWKQYQPAIHGRNSLLSYLLRWRLTGGRVRSNLYSYTTLDGLSLETHTAYEEVMLMTG